MRATGKDSQIERDTEKRQREGRREKRDRERYRETEMQRERRVRLKVKHSIDKVTTEKITVQQHYMVPCTLYNNI